ncbi:MAG: Eco57I restriction-modification methylase domain-containing protein [Acidobacteriota bacterium]|nr:Eco57I restriction-modification methylase domain-containing protein [Acidobacteriota bacterium]
MKNLLELQKEFEITTSLEQRKLKGQFFTPPEIAHFMAGLFSLPIRKTFRLLDPGAGIGALSSAFCDRVSQLRTGRRLEIHLFESDEGLLPSLRRSMEHSKQHLAAAGHSLFYSIHEGKDFIIDAAAEVFGEPSLFSQKGALGEFDGVIMNPPYFKLNKDSEYARVMKELVHGQPNIYAFFLAAAAQLLRPGGEMVAITPRSFCNGLYFRDFRRSFFDRMSLDRIHLFESRTGNFRDVLQESLITVSHRGEQKVSVTVSSSNGPAFTRPATRELPSQVILDRSSVDQVVRIPASTEDSQIMATVESWPHHFEDLGLRVSTGPVVSFRATQFLLDEANGNTTAPLISIYSVRPFKTVWPNPNKKHPAALQVCPASMRLLLPTRNYVLLRRFSAKEEPRRLTASCFLKSDQERPYVALENHLNYVYHAERELTVNETYGLAALFNSALLDRYFRTISGNTQVNATELRTMNFPDLKTLASIGKDIQPLLDCANSTKIERIVLKKLGVGDLVESHLIDGMLV